MAADSQLDVKTEDLYDLILDEDEIELRTEDIVQVAIRSLVLLLVILGSIILVVFISRRKQGILNIAILFLLVQIIWQALSWFSASIDIHFTRKLECPEVDCDYRRKIYKFCENLFHGLAVYTGVLLVAKLEGLTGVILWILYAMCGLAPLIYSLILLLLDLFLSIKERVDLPVKIGVAAFGGLWLNLVPAGLLISWAFGKLVSGYTRVRTASTRQTASHLIAILLVMFHFVHFSRAIVYIVATASDSIDTQISLAPTLLWLEVTGHILAALAIPWAWLAGLLIPRRDATSDTTEMNLKLAKQNKSRNIIKYSKEKKSVETPPQTPYKFQPEVTSSPSATSQVSNTYTQEPDGNRSKRSSYHEAMSTGSIHDIPNAQTKSRSEDPLWLTPTHLEHRV